MRAFKVIREPKAFELLADETRRRMIYLLRVKEMTVSQIAAELGLTPQAIYHHIRKLKEAGMVEVAREERVDHFIETYYQATAELFHIAHGESESLEDQEKRAKEALRALGRLGLPLDVDDATVAKIVDLERRLDKIGLKSEWTEKAGELEDVSFPVKWSLEHYAKLCCMTDEEFEGYAKLSKELRKTLRSRIVESAKPVASTR